MIGLIDLSITPCKHVNAILTCENSRDLGSYGRDILIFYGVWS